MVYVLCIFYLTIGFVFSLAIDHMVKEEVEVGEETEDYLRNHATFAKLFFIFLWPIAILGAGFELMSMRMNKED